MTAKPKDSISFKWPKPTPTKQDAKPRNHDEDESESFCESSPFGRMAFLCFFAWWFVHTFLFAYKKNIQTQSPFSPPLFLLDFWMVQKLLQMTYSFLFIGVALGLLFTGRNAWCSMGFSLGRRKLPMVESCTKCPLKQQKFIQPSTECAQSIWRIGPKNLSLSHESSLPNIHYVLFCCSCYCCFPIFMLFSRENLEQVLP